MMIALKIIVGLFCGLVFFIWCIVTIRQFFLIYGTDEQKKMFTVTPEQRKKYREGKKK